MSNGPGKLTPQGGGDLTLDDILGRIFIDVNTGFGGVLKKRVDRRTGQPVYYLTGAGGRAQNLSKGAQLIDTATREWINIAPGGGDVRTYGTVTTGGKASDADIERLFGDGDGAKSYAPPAYSGTPAGIEHQARLAAEAAAAQRKWEEDEAERRRIWEEGEAEKARLLKERLQKMDIARSLAETATGARLRGIEHRTETAGRDPFKLTALLAGEARPTGTPMDVHKSQLASFINAPVPIPAELESIEQLDAAIAQLGKMQQLPQPGPMGGFAKGTKGTFGILVGEGEDGGGLAGGTAEVLELRPDGTIEAVIPIRGRAAAGFKAEDFGGFRGLFASMRESAGLPRTLFSLTSPYGGQNLPMGAGPGDIRQPSPFMTPDIWAQDIRSKLGVVDPAKRTGLGAQPAAWQPLGWTSAITPGLRDMGWTDPKQLHEIAGLAVGLLPAPFKIGNFFSRLDPSNQAVILKAYEMAEGMSEATFRNLAMAPMIRGQERGLTTIG